MTKELGSTSLFLRNALRSNAVFSTLSGATFLFAAPWIASRMGIGETLIVRAVGVSLLVFAAGLVLNASRTTVNRIEAWLAVTMDALWVAGSAVLIAFQVLTLAGNWAVAVVADIVLIFAILQVLGLRKARF